MIWLSQNIELDEGELQWSFVRAGGPGGQNVNKVATKAELRWNVEQTEALPEEAKQRFLRQQKNRITNEGELIITSQRYRDQDRNRQDCMEKLRDMVREALTKPKPRKKTRPSRAAHERRIKAKKQRSAKKAMRQRPPTEM